MPNETLIDIDHNPSLFTRGLMADARVEQAGIEYWELVRRRKAYYEAHPPLIISMKKTPWQKFCEGLRLIFTP